MQIDEYLARMFNDDATIRNLFAAIASAQMAEASDILDTCDFHREVGRAVHSAMGLHSFAKFGYTSADLVKAVERLLDGRAA